MRACAGIYPTRVLLELRHLELRRKSLFTIRKHSTSTAQPGPAADAGQGRFKAAGHIACLHAAPDGMKNPALAGLY